MNNFGDFLYSLRKEKGMTQAELADKLGVTNKAVSKWETGEAMPETSLLLPLSRIFDVSVDELLAGKRADKDNFDKANSNEGKFDFDEMKKHLFTRGKDDDKNKSLADAVCGAICSVVIFLGVATYLTLGAVLNFWHPYWVIIPTCAMFCGIVGIVCELCNPQKRRQKRERGENPFVGAACGIVMLLCIISYFFFGVFMDLWHPLWILLVAGAFFCVLINAVNVIVSHTKKRKG